ncbi:MAG: hypothetical protein ACNYZG_04765 [Gammaproteobacteria bacterium]
MYTITLEFVDQIFARISSNISSEHNKVIHYLEDIKPKGQHQIETIAWRYNLSGFVSCLSASDIIDEKTYTDTIETLFCKQASHNDKRPGRDFKYNVDIITEKDKIFSFDVMSMNPVDAYVQLTKRIAYKAIPGIEAVLVYAGLKVDRNNNSNPVQSFAKDELIFVTLL